MRNRHEVGSREGKSDSIAWLARRADSCPVLRGDAELFWRAFHELQGDRQSIGMGGLGVISFVAIDVWARRHGIDGEDFQWLLAALSALTDLQIRHEGAERQRRQKQQAQR